MNWKYLHNAYQVLKRENACAFLMEGGVLAFLAKPLGELSIVKSLVAGSSVLANQFYKVAVHPASPTLNPCLLQEQVMVGE